MRTLTATLLLVPLACVSCERGAAQDPSTLSPIAPPSSLSFPAPKVELAPGARKIFVSSQFGDDRNTGTSSELPVKTIKRGTSLLRAGKADWLLLRRGDTFREAVGRWRWAGRSAEHPALVGAYGKGPRPLLLTGKAGGLFANFGGGSAKQLDHVVVQGLHFYAHTRDPASTHHVGPAGRPGLQWLVGGVGLVVDDCVFQAYPVGVVIQDFYKKQLRDVVFRRTQFLDSYSVASHSQGIYAEGVNGLTFEGCLFDHNGWTPKVPKGKATMFNHNLYIQSDCRRVVMRRNIILQGASHGAQVRCGGLLEDNLFVRNAIGLLIGGGGKPVPGGVTATVSGNVLLAGRDIRPDLPRGWGIEFKNIKAAVVSDTIVANVLLTGVNTRSIESNDQTVFKNVIVHAWPGNEQFSSRAWRDPTRTIEGYHTARGGKQGWKGLVAALRRQRRGAWDPAYSCGALIAWIRAGFQFK